MAIWERYDQVSNLLNVGDHVNTQLFHNQATSDNFQSADIVVVDGIVTVLTNTDDLVGVRLLVVDEGLVDADLTEDDPAPHHHSVYYSWFCGRGPLVFRLRAKRTIPPEHKLWLQAWKAQGGSQSAVRTGEHFYMQLKH